MSELNSSSSHRHDNRTELEKLLNKSKPWLEENGTLAIYGLAAVLAIAAVVVFLNRQPQGEVQASQDLLSALTPKSFGNQKPGEFRDVADAFPTTAIGTWSRLRQADLLLDNAISNMFSDRPASAEQLDQAQAAYERLANQSEISQEIRERALIGLARLTEARCDGKPDSTNAAVSAWQRVLEEFPESIIRKQAEDRVAALGTEESRSFYTWFSAQNPVPVDPGLEPEQPNVPSIPSHPSFDTPALPEIGLGTSNSTEQKTGATSTGDGTKPDTDKEAGDNDKPDLDETTTPAADPQDTSDAEAEAAPAVKPLPAETKPASETKSTESDEAKTPGSDDKESDSASSASQPQPTAGEGAADSPEETQK